MTSVAMIATWATGSCISTELLGYWLHRLLHSGAIGSLSRNHMKHHLVMYGPLQEQCSKTYRDATEGNLSLGNICREWLFPAGRAHCLCARCFPRFSMSAGCIN